MSYVIIYGNTNKTPEGYHEVSPDCLDGLQKVVKEYGVPSDYIKTATTPRELEDELYVLTTLKYKVTLVIPGGYTSPLLDSLEKIEGFIQQLIEEGKLNFLGSCSGMRWLLGINHSLTNIKKECALESCPLPDCKFVKSFQKIKDDHHHLVSSKSPVISSSLLPEGENEFQAYWNSGVCAYFGEKEQLNGKLADEFRSRSIVDYRKEDLFQVDNLVNAVYSNHQALCKRKYLSSEVVEPKEEYYPHAGVIRTTPNGSVVAAIGFHPEIPLKEEDIDPVLGISYKENERRGKQFLFHIFDQFGLAKEVADGVDQVAKQVLDMKVA